MIFLFLNTAINLTSSERTQVISLTLSSVLISDRNNNPMLVQTKKAYKLHHCLGKR